MGPETPLTFFFPRKLMATDEVTKNYFARFIGHEMLSMVFSSDFHGILTNLSFIAMFVKILNAFENFFFLNCE